MPVADPAEEVPLYLVTGTRKKKSNITMIIPAEANHFVLLRKVLSNHLLEFNHIWSVDRPQNRACAHQS